MKLFYTTLFALAAATGFSQQTFSFEASEGYQLGTINGQNGWEVTEGSDGFIQNQVISDENASQGTFSFKNGYEPSFDFQWFPIFGATKAFETPVDHSNFSISYDVLVTAQNGADFEFILYSIDENEEFVPVAGVGIENRGYIYLTKDVNYGFEYAEAEWTPNQWTNIKIEVTDAEIKYYVNNVLQQTIENFTGLDIHGFNMLHNNYGADGYYDNFIITTGSLSTSPFERSEYTVYPNPAKDNLTIDIPAGKEIADVQLFNMTGQMVLQSRSQNINVSSLAYGAYVLKGTTTDGTSFIKKIVKN